MTHETQNAYEAQIENNQEDRHLYIKDLTSYTEKGSTVESNNKTSNDLIEAADRLAYAVGAFKLQQHVYKIREEMWKALHKYNTVRYGQGIEK